ncbi:MAG: hypothetical protein GY793_01170 [Proteobacteria bacterium]|nr:hypothetical protein [Pseudomonadota bacterium]
MLTFELIKKFNLPPDPGSANNDSIEGIVGKNLIRDDIERAIVAKYHKDPLKVKMLNIMSAIDTLIIRAAKAGDEPAYSKAMRDWSMITNCIMRSFEDQHLMLKWQRGITNNTDKRWEAEYARSSMGESVIEGAKYSEIMKHCERLKTQ